VKDINSFFALDVLNIDSMRKVEEARNIGACFRIHRTKDMKIIGFPKGSKWEAHDFFTHLQKNNKKGARVLKEGNFHATHWRRGNKDTLEKRK